MSKQHLRTLPNIQVPTNYPRDSKSVALSMPIFHSPKGRNALFPGKDATFDDVSFKSLLCLSSIWAAVSIMTNTDLCKNGMPIYFHIEDKVIDLARPIFAECGVPDEWIRITSFPEPDHIVDEANYGKKFGVCDDDEIDTDILIVWDTDAHVYRHPGEDVFQWYHRFETDLQERPLFSFYSDWNGHEHLYVNWLLRGVGLQEQEFKDDDPERLALMKLAEQKAYQAVCLQLPNQQHRWGSAIFSVPRKHPLFDFIRQHHPTSYADEALVTMYMNAHPETEFIELQKDFTQFVLSDAEFQAIQTSCIAHLEGIPSELPKYRQKFLSNIDGRQKITRPVEAPPKGRIHIFSVPHNPSHKDYSTCAFAQKARKLAFMADLVGYETYHYGNELSEVQCTENITVTTKADLVESYDDFITQSDFYQWNINHYAYKMFFLRAEHEVRKRFMPGDVLCYVFGPGQRPLYDSLQDLEGAIHCESGIGYYYPYAPYRVHESPGLMHFNLGIAQGQYDRWASMTEEEKKARPRNPNTEIHHSWMQWFDAVIPNSFDMEDFTYSETHDDYFLALGRIMPGKGLELAMRTAHALGKKLIIAGQGDFESQMGFKPWSNVEIFGRANIEERRELLANCIALMCFSTYPEPFGGVHVEANLSGKPVLSTDIGAYCHTVKHKLTGYRVKLNCFEQAIWAAKHVDQIDPATCRKWGQRFRNEAVAPKYDEYFASAIAYQKNNQSPFWLTNPDRSNLDYIDDSLSWLDDPIL